MRRFNNHSSLRVQAGRLRLTRAVAALTVLALLALLTSAPGSASVLTPIASESPNPETVAFQISGVRCSTEVLTERTRRDGTTITKAVQTIRTESSVSLMTGQLILRSTTVADPSGQGQTYGQWTMNPDASTGFLRGSFTGSVDRDGDPTTVFRAVGKGRRSLSGTAVTFEMMTSEAGDTGGPTNQSNAPCTADEGTADEGIADGAVAGIGEATTPRYQPPTGAAVVTSTKGFADTLSSLTDAIEANQNLRLIRTVDHRAAAANRDLELPPTTELIFGNPALGSPLMQAAQTTGIDLPQKMLVWEDLVGIVRVGYNAPAYLQSRHGIEGEDGKLQTISNALAGLAGTAAGRPADPVFDAGTVPAGAGLVTIRTERSPADAFAAIQAALETAPPVNVALALEHDVNAAGVGLDLRPTKLLVFGNPSLGTLLMQTDQSVALDLPQKILIYTDADGQTNIAYNDPGYIAGRHNMPGQKPTLQTLSGALASFANVGT